MLARVRRKVEEELQELFPETGILRMDADTTAGGHEEILQTFEQGASPFCWGRRWWPRDWILKTVTLVGVLSADISLYVDNYRAAERTFSLLTQVVGRAGRGGKTGRAVIQTYTPGNDVIQCAARQDYDAFTKARSGCAVCGGILPFADLFHRHRFRNGRGPVLRRRVRPRRRCGALRSGRSCSRGAGGPRPRPAPVVKVNNRFPLPLHTGGERMTRPPGKCWHGCKRTSPKTAPTRA